MHAHAGLQACNHECTRTLTAYSLARTSACMHAHAHARMLLRFGATSVLSAVSPLAYLQGGANLGIRRV